MYACCNVRLTKKRVLAFSAIGTAVAAASYFAFTATDSGTLLALSGVLGFAACPAMCAAMGGSMWLANRIGRKKKLLKRNHATPRINLAVNLWKILFNSYPARLISRQIR
jgi:hypothetical protein